MLVIVSRSHHESGSDRASQLRGAPPGHSAPGGGDEEVVSGGQLGRRNVLGVDREGVAELDETEVAAGERLPVVVGLSSGEGDALVDVGLVHHVLGHL